MKICVKCNCKKESSEFHKDQRRKDGLFPYCKECRRPKNPKKRRGVDTWYHSKGYILVRCESHPMAQKNGYVYEHRKNFYDENFGKKLNCEFCGADWSWRLYYDHIDHIDENKSNNDISKLRALCNSCNTKRTKKDNSKRLGAKLITYNGREMSVSDWAREEFVKVEDYNIRMRLKAGWSVEDALTKPTRNKRRNGVKPIA